MGGVRGGSMGGDGDGTRWLTYAELAAVRGITKASATRLAFRHKWPRKTMNDGQARVAVPFPALAPAPDGRDDDRDDSTHDTRDDITHDTRGGTLDTQEAQALGVLFERVAKAEGEASGLRQALAHAELRVASAEGRAERAEGERDQAWQEREKARVQAARAEGEAGALRDSLDAACRPAWRRWLGVR